VLPYGFLWSHESDLGRDDPAKERPCVVVLAVGEGDNPLVTVAPITSREPDRPGAVALRPGALGLSRASWIIPVGAQRLPLAWPRCRRGGAARRRLGALSPDLRRQLRERIEAALTARRARLTPRSE
jgi:mRNA-degrading endonuclease toxin of MazEF toxin-antitoxin module